MYFRLLLFSNLMKSSRTSIEKLFRREDKRKKDKAYLYVCYKIRMLSGRKSPTFLFVEIINISYLESKLS